MKLTTHIALKQLWSRHNYGFISFSTILSISGLVIGVSSLIIISCLSDGFTNVINTKLSQIDGHIRILAYNSESILNGEASILDSNISEKIADIAISAPYLEKHAMLKNNIFMEGVIVYGIERSSLHTIFHLDQFALHDSLFIDENSIILGAELAKKLNVNISDSIIVFDIEGMSKNNIIKAKKLSIANIFKTNFPEYDRLLAFMPLKTAQVFFNTKNSVSGLVFNIHDPMNADIVENIISDTILSYPYISYNWKDRHQDLLKWLTIYDIPIKIIMLFITAIGLFNIGATLWMIVIEKTKEFAIMRSMGLCINDIKKIVIKEGFIIGFIGSAGGSLLSLLLLLLQKSFHFITLPDDIYFMDYLPVKINIIYFILYPLSIIFITIIFSYLPARRSIKIPIIEALHYE